MKDTNMQHLGCLMLVCWANAAREVPATGSATGFARAVPVVRPRDQETKRPRDQRRAYVA